MSDQDIWGRDAVAPLRKLRPAENLVLVPVPENAVIIIRAENGYILREIEDGQVKDSVFEEPEVAHEHGLEEALANCLYRAFEGSFQSKWRGGLKLAVRQKGREVEGEESEG